jgi:hypothetical protein
MEMSQILSKGEHARGNSDGDTNSAVPNIDLLLGGYEEVRIPAAVSNDEAATASKVPTGNSASTESGKDATDSGGSSLALILLGGMALAVLLGGSIIALRAHAKSG